MRIWADSPITVEELERAGVLEPGTAASSVGGMFEHGHASDDIYRAAIRIAWEDDPQLLVDELGDRLEAALRKAAFDISALPARPVIYRGGTLADLEAGWSWTRSRLVANRFAFYRRAVFGGQPRVIRARVSRARVLAYWPEGAHFEGEVIIPGVGYFEEVPPVWEDYAVQKYWNSAPLDNG